MKKIRLYASVYFAIQGLGVFAWWAVLFLIPASRQYFRLDPSSDTSLLAFWLPDLVFLGVGSFATASLLWTDSRYARHAVWLVSGAIAYAMFYCLSSALMTDVGWLGVVLMFPAMIWSGNFAIGTTMADGMFREATESSSGWIVTKTSIQIVVAWSVILLVMPYLITLVEDKLGISRLAFPMQRPLAAAVFVAVSSIGLTSAYFMSRIGRGTPLPLDHARHLVICGPYAFVRNPMAVSGIGQGLAVALFLGSPLVALYALTGSLIWQFIFRPPEEDNLAERFGSEYQAYRKAVKCWIPRLSRYHTVGTADSSNSIVSPSGRM
jgi:protein-S-isoprenylcysteine O-methyltransferase Ste14